MEKEVDQLETDKTDGGAAFPKAGLDPWGKAQTVQIGMSLRDYFAAKAMLAAAINPVGAEGFDFRQRAVWAYAQADAMLAERAK